MRYTNFTPFHRRRLCYITWLLLVLPLPLAAGGGELAPGLILVPPENLIISREKLEILGGQTALVGYVEGQPAYFVAAEVLNPAVPNQALWAKLEAGMKAQSDTKRFDVLGRGNFQTHQGLPVHYKIYNYTKGGKAHQQAFHLIKGEESGFWIYATAVESMDLQALLPLIKAVLRRAELAEPQ